jgi:hypothetical protein
MSTVEDDNIRQPPHYREGGPAQVVTADTARQGPSGWRVLIVLVVSLIVAGVAWGAIGLLYGQM